MMFEVIWCGSMSKNHSRMWRLKRGFPQNQIHDDFEFMPYSRANPRVQDNYACIKVELV